MIRFTRLLFPAFAAAAATAAAADLPQGAIVDEVRCAAAGAQSYALFLPSAYTPDRAWPIILAFDPRARGRTPVERYQAAAEKFGYIVAGSNNSRNGSWEASMNAAQAMAADVSSRFRVDTKRVYTAGMSGGARVALGVALATDYIAGVIASSAGYPDSKPRKTVPFVLFGTAGTEDFNYLELRELDRTLTSPHRVAIFDGGHVWLSSELALEAVEWIELQAMASGRAPRREEWMDQVYTARLAAAERLSGSQAARAWEAIAADFKPFRDVSAAVAKAAALRKEKNIRDALKREKAEEDSERQKISELLQLERGLSDRETKPQSLSQLREIWKRLGAESAGSDDSSARRVARRVTRGLAMSARERTSDADYLTIVQEYRPQRNPQTPLP